MVRVRFRQWLEATAISNPVERGQAAALQIMLLFIAAFGVFLFVSLIVIALFGPPDSTNDTATILSFMGLLAFFIAGVWGTIVILRRGHFQAAVILAAIGFTVLHGFTVISLGIADNEVLLVYFLPLILAGLLSSRRALPAVILIAVATVWLTAFISPTPPLPPGEITGPGAPSSPLTRAFNFSLIAVISGAFFAVFGNVLAAALSRALAREQELEELKRNLELTVNERTTELRTALSEVENRAAAQSALLAENIEQREVIREMSVPVLPVSDTTLVLPLVGALDSRRLQDAQEHALTRVERTRAKRLILDITGVPIVDTQVAQGLVQMVQSVRLLGAEAVVVGIRPEVAQTIVGLGLALDNIRTASDVQSALQGDSRRG